jgi:hypothetical protein
MDSATKEREREREREDRTVNAINQYTSILPNLHLTTPAPSPGIAENTAGALLLLGYRG